MYSGKIEGEPTTFGTSGLLYRSNKVMYDRLTGSLWHQFTGEPIIGPLWDSGIKLPFFPVLLTTWEEWAAEHPDTTVLSQETGLYPAEFYVPRDDPRSIYYDYWVNPDTRFPVWKRSDALETKEVVLGLAVDDSFKAYPVAALQQDRVINDSVGGTDVVVIASPNSEAARVYERGEFRFALGADASAAAGLPTELVDSDGGVWQVTEEHLVSAADASHVLGRLPTHMSFWFGWFQFHPDTEIYSQGDSR